jgi:hypothetical protein
MTAPNCYACKHRRDLPGSAHSQCGPGGMRGLLVGILVGRGELQGPTLNPHGVRNGWANWPLDYDPVWVEYCTGFTPKGSATVPDRATP